MNGRTIRRLLLVVAVTATIGVAPTAAGNVGKEASPSKVCPDRAGARCKHGPVAPGAKQPRGKQQRPSVRPQLVIDSRGQPAWRSGTWLMY
jgi:hypothetical protein